MLPLTAEILLTGRMRLVGRKFPTHGIVGAVNIECDLGK